MSFFESAITSMTSAVTPIVLCGGLGTRVRSVLNSTPKSLAQISGRPFLEILFEQLIRANFSRVILATGHQGKKIEQYFGSNFETLSIQYSAEHYPLGTAGAVRLAWEAIDTKTALVLNGDSVCDLDLNAMYQNHCELSAQATMGIVEVPDTSRFGTVIFNTQGVIEGFREKQGLPVKGWINSGVYLLNESLITHLPLKTELSLELEYFPRWVGGNFRVFKANTNHFVDIGTPDSLNEAERMSL